MNGRASGHFKFMNLMTYKVILLAVLGMLLSCKGTMSTKEDLGSIPPERLVPLADPFVLLY